MDDALDEQHVFAWVEEFFKFDSRQDQEFFAPKEIVRDMLQHDEYLANTMKSQTGARAINNCIIDIISCCVRVLRRLLSSTITATNGASSAWALAALMFSRTSAAQDMIS